ncbi:MAG: serine hydrolase [Hungatella sp.]
MKSLWNADLGDGTYRNPILYTDCSDPEGIPKKALDAYFRYIQQGEVKLHSFMLLRGTHVLEERYFGSIHKETPQRMYSISKSMTSIAIGILIRDGKINLQDKICQYFPDKDFIYITTADAEGGLAQTTKLYEAFWKYIYPFIESPLQSSRLLKKMR